MTGKTGITSMNQRSLALLVFASLLLAAVFLAVRPSTVHAQTPTPPSDDAVNAIARQLFCPICENTPLDVCPTQACANWRELIRQMLADGKGEEEIKQFFVEKYGARVLGAPPAQGINWLAYIVPPVIFLAGAFLLVQAFRSWRRMSFLEAQDLGSNVPAKLKKTRSASDDEYVARLEAELKKRK